MTKAEFLEALRMKLMGEVSTVEIENTIRYYDEYIRDKVNQGKTEEQVLSELGSPLLIARTIIDTAGQEKNYSEQRPQDLGNDTKQTDINVRFGKVKVILVAAAVLFLAFTILRMLLPILLPLLVVWLIVTMFRNGGRR